MTTPVSGVAALSTGDRGMDRRGFVGVCGGALAGAAITGCASVMVRPVTAVDGRVSLALSDHPELARPNGSIAIQVAGIPDPLLVLNAGERRYVVLSPICTHRGCTVEVAGDRLECPCHGSQYTREGGVMQGPAERALQRFTAAVSDQRLVIDLRGTP